MLTSGQKMLCESLDAFLREKTVVNSIKKINGYGRMLKTLAKIQDSTSTKISTDRPQLVRQYDSYQKTIPDCYSNIRKNLTLYGISKQRLKLFDHDPVISGTVEIGKLFLALVNKHTSNKLVITIEDQLAEMKVLQVEKNYMFISEAQGIKSLTKLLRMQIKINLNLLNNHT